MRHNSLHNPYLASLNCVQTQLAEAFHSGLKRNFPEPACQKHFLPSKMVPKICMRHTSKHSGFLHQKSFPLCTQQNTADIWGVLRVLKNRLQTYELRSESNVPTDQRFLTFSRRHTLGLCVRRHDLNLVVYYQNDKMHFKQTVFSSGTVRVTQGASGTPASTCWSAAFCTQESMPGSCIFFVQYIVTNTIAEVVKCNFYIIVRLTSSS